MNRRFKVSVILCAYTVERVDDIHEAVDSLLNQTLKPYEVIISIDHNGGLFQRLRQELPANVSIVANNGLQGLSETRNVGIRVATGDIVAFIDDDAVAEEDWLENLTNPFRSPATGPQSPNASAQSPNVVAVGGRAIPLWHNGKRPTWFAEELDWIVGCTYKGLPSDGNEIRNVAGCNMAFRSDVFGQVGFWGTEIGATGQSQKGGEEAELCLRIKRHMPDAVILYEPAAVIHHKVPEHRATLMWILKNSYDQGICKAKLEKLSTNPTQSTQQTQRAPRTQPSLSTETVYLRYLLFTSIPERLKRFYKEGSLSQVGAIILSIAATGIGYLVARAKQ